MGAVLAVGAIGFGLGVAGGLAGVGAYAIATGRLESGPPGVSHQTWGTERPTEHLSS